MTELPLQSIERLDINGRKSNGLRLGKGAHAIFGYGASAFNEVLRKRVSLLLQAMKVQQFHRPTMRRHQASIRFRRIAGAAREKRLRPSIWRNRFFGICHICGEHKKLSFEHVPPRAAFNPLLEYPFNLFSFACIETSRLHVQRNMTKSVHLLARKIQRQHPSGYLLT